MTKLITQLRIFFTYTNTRTRPKKAIAEKINLLVICDEFCHWARELSDNVINERGDVAKAHMQKVTNLSSQFAGYESQ